MENVLSVENLINELRMCRSNLTCLIDKAWELGGCYSGEEEFESFNDIKDARVQIEKINIIETLYHNSTEMDARWIPK